MVEPLLVGIVLGLIPVTLAGLFVAAYMQYKRGDQLGHPGGLCPVGADLRVGSAGIHRYPDAELSDACR